MTRDDMDLALYILAAIGGWVVITLAAAGVVTFMKRGGKN